MTASELDELVDLSKHIQLQYISSETFNASSSAPWLRPATHSCRHSNPKLNGFWDHVPKQLHRVAQTSFELLIKKPRDVVPHSEFFSSLLIVEWRDSYVDSASSPELQRLHCRVGSLSMAAVFYSIGNASRIDCHVAVNIHRMEFSREEQTFSPSIPMRFGLSRSKALLSTGGDSRHASVFECAQSNHIQAGVDIVRTLVQFGV